MTSRNERSSSSSSAHYYPEDLLYTNSNAVTMSNSNGNNSNNNDDQNNSTNVNTLLTNGVITPTTTATSDTIINGAIGINSSSNNNNSNSSNNINSNKQSLFELVNVHNRITLDNVYQNGLHALKRLEIRNLTDQRILVKMRSNLRNQIAFQLDNENLHNLPTDVIDAITTTNTVDWARNEASNEFHFNQLFNYVNHIDHLELAPQESRPFILAFLPETNRRMKEDMLTRGNNDEDDDVNDSSEAGRRFSLHDPAAEEGNMYETFNVTGSLFFFGYYVNDEPTSTTASTIIQQQQQQQQHQEQHQQQEQESTAASISTPALYQLSVKFRASVCQSVMWTDVAETGVNFDDCMLGEECHKDFTIQNNSDVELHWLVNTVDLSNLNREGWLQFSDAETGRRLLDYEPIPGHSHRRVRLTFMPKEVGEFNYDLQIENANDARNVVQTKVHASVRSILRQESLIISSGNVIDFGDCISGTWTMRQIVLNNVGESPVEVRFIPETADVVFDIKAALEPGTAAASTSQQQQHGGKTKEQQQLPDQEFSGRLFGGKQQHEPEKGSSSILTTTPTGASISEVSVPNSEVSSRASSPTSSRNASRTVEYESSPSPTSQESYGNTNSSTTTGAGARIQTPADHIYESSTNDDSASRLMELSRDRASTPTLNSAGSYTRIEDLVLRPGKERVIQVSYRPRKDASINDFNAGQLIRRNFRIVLEYGCDRSGTEPKERKAIQCKARTCTSFVEAIPKSINFGDTDVGTLKSLPINIFNRSDIIARVELQFSSKVLNCLRGEIVIQPRSYVELKLDLYPRKVNPEYRKQITLVNYLNRDNDQIIEVQSTNIDKNRVTFHSLFYRILTTTGANFLDFGSIVLNSPAIRTFTVENIRSAPLTLEVTTSLPGDITVFVKKKRSDQRSTKIVTSIASTGQQNLSSVKKAMDKSTLANLDRNIATGVSMPRPLQTTIKKVNNGLPPPPIHRGQTSATAAPSAAVATDSYSTAYLDLATTPLRHSTSLRRKQILLKSSTKPILTQASHISRVVKHHRVSDLAERKSTKHKNRGSSKESMNTSAKNDKPNGLRKRLPHREDSFDGDGIKSKRSLGITAARYRSRKNLDWADIAGKSRVPFEDLISVLEHGSKAATPLFPKQSAEERFVRQQLAWRRELDRLIEKGDLVRSSTIEVDPHGEEEVVIVFTPNGETKQHVQSAPKKQDARIFLRLISFDRNIEQEEFTSLLYGDQSTIPVREVIVRAQLCRSIMDLGQKNINFGLVERNERHAKSIILHNRSETPLLYAIRKSGSIASGDIILGAGRYGVVRAFGKREIEFVFEPTLAGHFMERLIVENIRDRTNDRVLLLKAMVRKPSTFFIKSLELNFGPCLVDQTCQRVETIVFTNTNKQTRLFEIRVDPNEANFGRTYGEFDFVVEDDESSQLSKEAEEEIENLEQKLKIARRKKQPDKEKKYLKKLAKLRKQDVPEEEEEGGGAGAGEEDKEKEKGKEKKKKDKGTNGTASTTAGDDQGASSSKKSSTTNEETIKENSNIFKKTPESVVFPLDPNATKTISVRFKAITRPIQIDNNTPVEHIQQVRGQIMAHEYKNTDTNKMISYTATLCEDQSAYKEALANESSDKQIGSSEATSTAATTTTDNNIVIIESASAETRTSRTDPMMDDHPEPLKLERSVFDGGRVEIDQKSTFYVRVSNDSNEPLEYEFLLDSIEKDFFICPETTTPLAAKEVRKLMFEILPTSVGKQEHTFCIRNCRTNVIQTFTLECLVHYKSYLAFPSLSEGNQGELDLGFSYVDPGTKYSQVTPLLVKNVSGQDLFITCQSNLSHQVLIFVDEAGERGLVDMMPFKSGSMTTVWVAVQPNLLTGYLGSSSADECRELVGGIKFSIYTENDQAQPTVEAAMGQESAGRLEDAQEGKEGDEKNNDRLVLMLTQTVKFISIIGQSHLEVSHQKINLGYTDKLGAEFYGAFTIKNKSGQLPLDYEVECPSRNVVLDRRGGTLNGWRGIVASNESALDYLDQKERRQQQQQQQQYRDQRKEEQVEQSNDLTNTQTMMSVAQITFRIHAYRYGLLSEKLIVTNKHNSQEVFEIEVRFFVKQHNIEAWMVQGYEQQLLLRDTADDNDEGVDDEHHKEANPLPVVQWESIYVCPATNHSKTLPPALQVMMLSDQDEARLYVREIEVANISNQPMQLIALSDIDITAGWVADEDKVRTAYVVEEGAYLQRSGQLILDPGQRVRVRLQCPSPEKLTDHDRAQALQGRSGVLSGMFILYDMQQQVEVLALELKALFCVSVAELAVDRIDLGQIGHTASWKPVKFSFTIRNIADVPLNYDIIHPDFMSFVPKEQSTQIINRSNVSNVTTFDVEPRKNQIVQGTLDPRQLRDQSSGQRRFDIRLDNNYNQNNTMTLKLRALMTAFELEFERLTNNEELVLPPLYHPIAATNVSCDSWFVVHNTTDDDIRFEIGADISPGLEEYLKIDVLSRYTNTPLRGGISVSPQGRMEVRVRATPNGSARLPHDRPDLLDPEGIILANLWVTTRPIDMGNDEENRKLREMIPIRSTLIETPIFTLSERRLDFELVTYYQEENGQGSSSPSASASTSPPQLLSAIATTSTVMEGLTYETATPIAEPPSSFSSASDNNKIMQEDSMNNDEDLEVVCRPDSHPLTILNHATKLPLRYKVTIEGPAEFPAQDMVQITPLSSDGTGVIEADSTVTLNIRIANPKDSIPGQIRIQVDDLDAVGLIRQTASIFIKETVWDL